MSEATISSLTRAAAKSEESFVETTEAVLAEESPERIADYFDRLNIPRSVGSETYLSDLPEIKVTADSVTTWAAEKEISDGIQKFLDRHARKLKWHATHPSMDGVENVFLLTRCAMIATNLRLARMEMLLRKQAELSPLEWSYAREFMNRTYLSFKAFLVLLAGEWIDAMQTSATREELAAKVGNFYVFVDAQIRRLEEARERIEERRLDLTVIPEEFPPVRPPGYFGGDLMGRGPWKQFWAVVDTRAHHFRELAG